MKLGWEEEARDYWIRDIRRSDLERWQGRIQGEGGGVFAFDIVEYLFPVI